MLSTSFASPIRKPSREPGSTWGAALMFSWPPATTISASPATTAFAASITAFRPEPHTLLIVMPGTAFGSPAAISAWRAGFWPEPAVSTWPRITSLTCSGFTPARSSTARITLAPSSGAAIFASEPPNLPTAVRAADTITTSVISLSSGRARHGAPRTALLKIGRDAKRAPPCAVRQSRCNTYRPGAGSITGKRAQPRCARGFTFLPPY